jgi:uncharacterized protein YjlB
MSNSRLDALLQISNPFVHLFGDDSRFPNNERLPLVLYQNAVKLPQGDPAATFEEIFHANEWGSSWRNGIYPYHHYHSTAHEVLGISRGKAAVRLGGDARGQTFEVRAGDVIIIPAGVAHKNLGSSSDFLVVGAYPLGQKWDMNYGKLGERPQADRNVAQVPLPTTDPVYGRDGQLAKYWHPFESKV